MKRTVFAAAVLLSCANPVWAEQDFYGVQIRNEAWARSLVLGAAQPDPKELRQGPVVSHSVRAEASLKELGDQRLDLRVTIFNDSAKPIPADYELRDFVVYTRGGKKFPLVDSDESLPGYIEPKSKLTFSPSAGNLRLRNSEVEMIQASFDLGRTSVFLFPWSKKDMVSKLANPELPAEPEKPEHKQKAAARRDDGREARDLKELSRDVKEIKQMVRELKDRKPEVVKEVQVKEVVKEVPVEKVREIIREVKVEAPREETRRAEVRREEPAREVEAREEPVRQESRREEPKKEERRKAEPEPKRKALPADRKSPDAPRRGFWDWLKWDKPKRSEPPAKESAKPAAAEMKEPAIPAAAEKSAPAPAKAASVEAAKPMPPSPAQTPETSAKLEQAIENFKYVPADKTAPEPKAAAAPKTNVSVKEKAAEKKDEPAKIEKPLTPMRFLQNLFGDGLKMRKDYGKHKAEPEAKKTEKKEAPAPASKDKKAPEPKKEAKKEPKKEAKKEAPKAAEPVKTTGPATQTAPHNFWSWLKLDKPKKSPAPAPAAAAPSKPAPAPAAPSAAVSAAEARIAAAKRALDAARSEAHVVGFDKEYGFITLNIGKRDGLRKNTLVAVMREGRLVAKAKVRQLRDAFSAATVISSRGEIRPGDKIALVY